MDKAGITTENQEEMVLRPTNPEILRKEGNELINAGKFEDAIQKMAEALQLQVALTDDEFDYSLAQYFYSYGDAVLAKISSSTELFGDVNKKRASPQPNEEEKGQENEEVDDVQIAWENLEMGRVICTKKLDEQNLSEEMRKEVSRMLGSLHLDLGEILAMQERKKDALVEYEKVLKIRKEYEDPDSRRLAEVYFNMGSILLITKGKEDEAIESLGNSAKILESCLKKALGKSVAEEEKELIKRDLVKANETDTSEVKELKEILGSIYDKVLSM